MNPLLNNGKVNYVAINEAAGTNFDLVATPGANKAILVLAYKLITTDGDNTEATWQDADGTKVTGQFMTDGDNTQARFSPVGHFQVTANKGLRLNFVDSEPAGGWLVYQTIDVSS